MKKILAAFDSAATKSAVEINDMKRFVSIVAEGAKEELEKIENHPAAQDSPEIQKAVDAKKAELAQEESVEEDDKRMSRAAKGHEKYGKKGMQALAKAGREGASDEKLDKIRDKHDKYSEGLSFKDYFNLVEATGKQKGLTEGSDNIERIKAKIRELEAEQEENEYGSFAYDSVDAELQFLYGKLDKIKKQGVAEEKQKGVDGKACWKGYKRMGTKQKGGKTVDNCVPTGKK